MKNKLLLLLAAVSLVFTGCKEEKTHVDVTKVTIDQADFSLVTGQTKNLTVTVEPENATDKTVNWTSDKPAVATVDTDGKVTAVSEGDAIITASSKDAPAKKHTVKVTVVKESVPVTSISLNKAETEITEGDTETLTVTIEPENATDKTVTWSSGNEAVATVDGNGVVTAVASGTAVITVMSNDDNTKTATCEVTVVARLIDAEEITLNETGIELMKGRTKTLTATVLPSNATDKTVIWSSEDEDTATVDENGLVTAIQRGVVNITATCAADDTIHASCEVTVVIDPETENILTEEYIPDPKFRKFVKIQIAEGSDTYTMKQAAEYDGDIILDNVDDINVENMKGLELFISAKLLHCIGNDLAELDVKPLTKLEILSCAHNELIKLNVTNNVNLLNLYCAYNKLGALDVSKCIKIEELLCQDNQLTELDLSALNELKVLSCRINQLKELNLSGHEKMEEVLCQDNRLELLDLTGCENIFYLNCSNNMLTELDISECEKLEEIYIGNNPLHTLYLWTGFNPNNVRIDINIDSIPNVIYK